MTEQFWHGWAVCHDDSGIRFPTIKRTRSEAICAWLEMMGPPETWRQWKIKGYRVSHVEVREMRFGQ